ncbi:MAG: hypothetical protein MUC36_17205 [Planctomycetes bacterium]|jgi:hypothetical protein|nr:hypothetical protein [Planctomycetota bacterium]
MYRLRPFEPTDLHLLAREVTGTADTTDALAGHPGGLFGVVVEAPRARLAAALVAVRHELVTPTRTLGVGIVRLAHVDEPARIGGIHSLLFELDSAFAERFEGPDQPFQAVVAQWEEQDLWWFRRLRDHEPIAASLSLTGVVAAVAPPDGVVIEPLAAAAIELLAFGAGAGTGLRRTREHLLHGARQRGCTAFVARRGSAVIGWAIVRRAGAEVVLEHCALDWAEVALVRAVLAAAAGGAVLRAVRWTEQAGELVALQAAGLRVAGPERVVAARISAFGLAPASIAEFASFGPAEVGASPLPRLTYNECIVTPPPPGQRSTQGDHRRSGNRQVHAR